VDAFRLQETSWDKKGFMGYVKGFMKKVADKLTPERKEKFMAEAPAAVKMRLGKFDELQFFMGETGDMEASLCYAYYKEGCAWRRVIDAFPAPADLAAPPCPQHPSPLSCTSRMPLSRSRFKASV